MASGNRLLEVDRWLVEVGCQRLEVGCCLMEGGCSLMKVAASNTISVSHTATSTIRLLLTQQRTTPWKASGAGVTALKEHTRDR